MKKMKYRAEESNRKTLDHSLFHDELYGKNSIEFILTSKRNNTETHNSSHCENQTAQRGPHPAT